MFRALPVVVLILALILWGCGGKVLTPEPYDGQFPPSQQPLISGETGGGQQPLNLVLRQSSVNDSSGNTMTVDVLVRNTGELKQASLRLLYPRQQFSPISIESGAALPGDAMFISSLSAVGVAYKNATPDTGVLPIAFTVLPGEQGITRDGVLAKIELEILQPGSGAEEIFSVLEDSDYLIFVDAAGKPIPVEISYEGAGNE